MIVNFPLEEIFGQNPKDVAKKLRLEGIDPDRPYRANVTFTGIVIEQDKPKKRKINAQDQPQGSAKNQLTTPKASPWVPN